MKHEWHDPMKTKGTIQIETVTTRQGKMDVIRDIEKVRRMAELLDRMILFLTSYRTPQSNIIASRRAGFLAEYKAMNKSP